MGHLNGHGLPDQFGSLQLDSGGMQSVIVTTVEGHNGDNGYKYWLRLIGDSIMAFNGWCRI